MGCVFALAFSLTPAALTWLVVARPQGCHKSNQPRLTMVEMQLRKCCNHPYLIAGVEDKETAECKTPDEQMDALVRKHATQRGVARAYIRADAVKSRWLYSTCRVLVAVVRVNYATPPRSMPLASWCCCTSCFRNSVVRAIKC